MLTLIAGSRPGYVCSTVSTVVVGRGFLKTSPKGGFVHLPTPSSWLGRRALSVRYGPSGGQLWDVQSMSGWSQDLSILRTESLLKSIELNKARCGVYTRGICNLEAGRLLSVRSAASHCGFSKHPPIRQSMRRRMTPLSYLDDLLVRTFNPLIHDTHNRYQFI